MLVNVAEPLESQPVLGKPVTISAVVLGCGIAAGLLVLLALIILIGIWCVRRAKRNAGNQQTPGSSALVATVGVPMGAVGGVDIEKKTPIEKLLLKRELPDDNDYVIAPGEKIIIDSPEPNATTGADDMLNSPPPYYEVAAVRASIAGYEVPRSTPVAEANEDHAYENVAFSGEGKKAESETEEMPSGIVSSQIKKFQQMIG